jgi:phosphoribosylformimino-5-aminoimidazole carboxamide ribotide isomerase
MRLIPAIDVRGGHCVRLLRGDFAAETRYPLAPGELLQRYCSLGAGWIHLVDLDGARHGAPATSALVAALAAERGVRLQVGGGVRAQRDIEALLDAGAERIVLGSAALERPAEVRAWLNRFGAARLCLAFDVRVTSAGEPRVWTHGWTRDAGVSLWEVLARYPAGTVRHVLCTDIARDGALSGPNLELYRAALERHPELRWQASGGVRHGADLAALARTGAAAAVVGRALLEDGITDEELRPYLPDASLPASTYATAGS